MCEALQGQEGFSMSKYDSLGRYLRSQDRAYIPMRFSEIERILNRKLPNSKKYPAWWSNNASNNVMTNQWLESGYVTESVDIASEKLVFRKASVKKVDERSPEKPNAKGKHPVFGCMNDTLVLKSDLDLTSPADPDWGDVYERP
jgi:hypothetical protein